MTAPLTMIALIVAIFAPPIFTAVLVLAGLQWMQRRQAARPAVRPATARLDELDALLAQGRISGDEHQLQRKVIIEAI